MQTPTPSEQLDMHPASSPTVALINQRQSRPSQSVPMLAINVQPTQPPVQGLPVVQPHDSLRDSFSNFQFTPETNDGPHEDPPEPIVNAVPMGQAVFFTDEEVKVLDSHAPPPQVFVDAVKQCGPPKSGESFVATGIPVAQSAPAVVAQPIITTGQGFPVLDTSAVGFTRAQVKSDGWSGVKSCDERLQNSRDELLLFFNSYNSKPLVGCRVEGYHYETRHRRVASTDSDGKTTHRTETYTQRVTDFHYKVDLTSFVYPHGYISSVDKEGLSVPKLCDKFIADSNLLKSLAMKKVVDFDFAGMRNMVYGYIRQLGWRRHLSITFPMVNTSVRVYRENWLSQAWENPCICCLCHVTIIPCILMRLYRGDCPCQEHHAESDVRSTFRIHYTSLQVFEAIKPQLWAPGFSGAQAAMELLRNIFW